MYAYESGAMKGIGEASAFPALSLPFVSVPQTEADRSSFGDRRGPNWAMIAAIAAMHILAVIALVKLDIIVIAKPKAAPLVVTLLSVPAPPPAAKVQPQPTPVAPVEPTIVTPPPIVQTIAPPPPVAVISLPAPKPVVIAPPAAPAAPVSVTNLDDSVIDGKAPRYPIESLRKKEQGTVMLRLTIGTNGTVADISVAQSSGFDRLDTAALRAVKLWRWRPMLRNGQPVEVTGVMAIPFVLKA